MKPIVQIVGVLWLLTAVIASIGTAQVPDASVQVSSVSLDKVADDVAVRIKTSGPTKYQSSFIDSPNRLVIDLQGSTYTWNKPILKSDTEPVREVRSSQFRVGITRVVVELTRKVGYRIDEDPDGLTVVLEPAGTAQAEKPTQKSAQAKAKQSIPALAMNEGPLVLPVGQPISQPATQPLLEVSEPRRGARVAAAVKAEPVAQEAMATVALAPLTPSEPEPVPLRVAQAAPPGPPSAPGPAPAPAPAPPSPPPPPPSAPPAPGAPRMPSSQAPGSSGKLISLDFKDADITNLLRILAAESGRNIVAGDDVKGKVSVSLHNVTWEQALDTILETRGLQRLDRNGIIRIVSTEQLTKEREAQARVQDALVKAETDARTRRADAEFKEAEAATKKLQADAAIAEAKARGPLKEETVRLSYADPEDVAKTLQGILGIPPSGTMPISSAPILSVPQNPTVVGSSVGPPNPALGRVPEANAPYPPVPITQPSTVVSVSQDVLAKGITIQAHKPTNSIFIRHYEADVERIKKLIRERFDIPLPQVKIEARMEILDRSAYEGIGVQWGGAGAGNINKQTTIIGQGFQSVLSPTGQVVPIQTGIVTPGGFTFDPTGVLVNPRNPNLNLNNLLPVSTSTGLPLGGNVVNLPFQALPNAATQGAPAGGIAFGFVSSQFNINLALQALANQGKTRTLARPEIVTVENSKATISFGEEIPYATVSSAGTQIQFKEAVLKLDVVPSVLREQVGDTVVNKIKMVVLVENNSRGLTVNIGGGIAVPAINKRKAETQVLIKAGDRLVVGGITNNQTINSIRKVPIFGDIPVLGWLFKQKEVSETAHELVLFLTPSIVSGQGTAGMSLTPVAPK